MTDRVDARRRPSPSAGQGARVGAAAIDVSPIVVRWIVFDTGEYIAEPPLRFEVSFDAEAGLFDLEGDFGVILCAETRDELEDVLADTLGLQWDEYALAGPDALSPKAQELRLELLQRYIPAAIHKQRDVESALPFRVPAVGRARPLARSLPDLPASSVD